MHGAAPPFPGDARGELLRQSLHAGTLLAGEWDADLQGAEPFTCKGSVDYFAVKCSSQAVPCLPQVQLLPWVLCMGNPGLPVPLP